MVTVTGGRVVPKFNFESYWKVYNRYSESRKSPQLSWSTLSWSTLPETNITSENGWLEYDHFLLGWPIFKGKMAVSFRGCIPFPNGTPGDFPKKSSARKSPLPFGGEFMRLPALSVFYRQNLGKTLDGKAVKLLVSKIHAKSHDQLKGAG